MTKKERKEAIEYLKKYRELDKQLYQTAPFTSVAHSALVKCLRHWDTAIQALKQEPCDAISLEAVIEWLKTKDIIKLSSQEEMARKELKALLPIRSQELCNDAVSRDAVQKEINCWIGSGEYKYTNATYYLMKRIKHISSVNPQKSGKWIPVSERLPEERDWCLAVFKEKDTGYQLIPRVADYIGKGENKWRLIDEDGLVSEYRDLLECIAWMPLPKPYEPQKSEEKG